MHKLVDPNTLKNWLHDGAEIALFDVREQGQYGEAHLFYGIPVAYSRLELDAPRLARAPRCGWSCMTTIRPSRCRLQHV